MKTISEQVLDLENTRAAKAARMQEVMSKGLTEGRSSDAEEGEEFDTIELEVKKLDEDLVRLRKLEKMNISLAKPVEGTSEAAAREPHQPYISVKSNLPKGTAFTRYAMSMIRAKGNAFEAAEFAKHKWPDTPELPLMIKTASDIGTTTDSDWATKLVYYTNASNEFIELLRPMTILGKFGTNGIPDLRRVPFNIRMVTQTGGGTYGWVGEGAAKPVGQLALDEVLLKWAKAAGIIVITEELAKFSTPSAEAIVRQDMLAGMAQFSDLQFIDPQVFAVADVSPASVTNLVTDTPASGTTAAAFNADVASMMLKMTTTNLSPTSGVWIMSSQQALKLALSQNALGQPAYPGMTMQGGSLVGFPVIVSDAVPNTSDGSMIVFLNANDIFFSDDGPVTIDASREASLQMNTTPDNPTSASTVMISLWQRNLIGLRAERYMNWKKRRAQAVQYISGANYA